MKYLVGTNPLLHQFIGTNPQETPIPSVFLQEPTCRRHQSPLLLCRNQPVGDTNALYYLLFHQVSSLIIPSLCLLVSSTFMRSTCCFFLHDFYLLLHPSPGLLLPKLVAFGFFQRTNLHKMPHIQFFKSSSKISAISTLKPLLCILQILESKMSQKEVIAKNSKQNCLKHVSRSFKNTKFLKSYL